MSFLIGLLTFVLVADCLLLVLLVLIQLPKKEAGAGIAFGGAAADALFGAGSGNVLTKATKYATIVFFVLLLLLGYLQSQVFHKPANEFQRKVEEQGKSGGLIPPPAASPTPSTAGGISNAPAAPTLTLTNLPVPAATPAPAPTPQK